MKPQQPYSKKFKTPPMHDEIVNMPPRPTVLVVDDTADNLMLMQALLKDHYKVKGPTTASVRSKSCAANHPPT